LKPHEPPDELRALRAELAQFRRVCNAVPVAIAYYERAGNVCRYANEGYAAMFGLDVHSILGLEVAEVIGAEAAAFIQPQVDRVLRELTGTRYERTIHAPDGDTRSIEVHLLPHADETGLAIGAFVLIADITRHRRAEAALRESEERLAKFMHASAEGIVFHQGGLITDANPPLQDLLGRSLAEMVGQPALDFVAPEMRTRVGEVMAAARETRYDTAVLHRDGTQIPVEFIVRTMNVGGTPQRMTIVRDIRPRLEAEARIHHLAHHDALTGLPNRMAFTERATALMAQARLAGRALALLFVDLDHFKRINDSLGHPVGDMLLQTVAGRISQTLREADLVSRFGGDEFVLLLHGAGSEQAVAEVARKLLAAIGEPLQVQGTSISVTPSIGVAMFPAHGETAAELVKHADTAMYAAKARGRAGYEFFRPAMAEAASTDLALEGRLAQAIRDREFVLFFQPQVNAVSGELLGIEALLRWLHPQQGLIGPELFIPLAEARRLILPIGRWVMQTALQHAVRWHDSGLAPVPVAVNLSTLEFQVEGFAADVERALAEAGATGALLELELTERMLMDELPCVQATLRRLRACGVRITVDDFGTGYTSLQHLQHLPLDGLKVDRSFVGGLPGDAASAAITGAVIQMGQGLGLQVVAEGVETAEQQAWLLARGCLAQQGLAHGEPMPAAALEAWLRARAAA
jgi:diguanylate cyclase (GGDEF)-like protein/PAS domain S-box-containing protein